jgi:hypothetical protein
LGRNSSAFKFENLMLDAALRQAQDDILGELTIMIKDTKTYFEENWEEIVRLSNLKT